MSKAKNEFSTEFKQECDTLVVNHGYSLVHAASLMFH